MTDLGTLSGDVDSRAMDVNRHGTIVGRSDYTAVSWDRQGRITELPSTVDDAFFSDAEKINDRGFAIGVSGSRWALPHATLWRLP
jgi:uncharacterized membrane protein